MNAPDAQTHVTSPSSANRLAARREPLGRSATRTSGSERTAPGIRAALTRGWYCTMWCACWVVAKAWFGFQYAGRRHVPKSGPVLLLANHQSNLDPVLVGIACPRRLCFLAKKSLFFWPLSWLIRSLGAVPLDLEGSAISGLKTTLRLLKQDEAVLVFPEGSRTHDGELQPLMAGFCPLARRSGATIVPLALDGAFSALPRRANFPRPGCITMQFAPPITPDEMAGLADEQLVDLVAKRMAAVFDEVRSGELPSVSTRSASRRRSAQRLSTGG